MSTLADRLQWAIDRAGVKPVDLARACGVKPPSVSGWLSGKTKTLKYDSATRAAALLRVNPRWLTNGHLPRVLGEHPAAAGVRTMEPPAEYGPPWPFTIITPARWNQLPALDRQRVETFADATIQAWEARHADKRHNAA